MSDLRRLPRRGQARARSLTAKLRDTLYKAPEWALFDEIRSRTGSTASMDDVLRVADAIAVWTWGPCHTWRIHGFETKLTRKDWLRELEQPEKCGPFKLFCSAWWLVVPVPWKHVVLSTSELPDGWGLLEIGAGAPHVVVEAREREAEEPSSPFLHALLRGASNAQHREQLGGAPLVSISRILSRQHVSLQCGHALVHPPIAKGRPEPVP